MSPESYHSTPLKYGSYTVDEFIPSSTRDVRVLSVEEYHPDFEDLGAKLEQVLEAPLGTPPFDRLLHEKYSPGSQVCVIVDDNTRPNVHTRVLLPMLLGRFLSSGVQRDDIVIMVATGSHKPPTEEALEHKVFGTDLYGEWRDRVLVHDCDAGNRYLGETSFGTPIHIDERVLDSCLVIVLSDSEYHYFAGQAGTVKLFCPGVAGRETIRINHPRMFDLEKGFVDTCRLGNTEGNPVIMDMIEIATRVKESLPMFCIDTIVDHGQIVYMQAGDIIECHRAAAGPLRRLRVVEVDRPGDIVFVSVGELGINLYQSGKGIHAAWNAVRHDGQGWIVLLAPCEEGIGSDGYAEAMSTTKGMPLKEAMQYVIRTYCSEKTFKIGNQKPPDLFRILMDVGEGHVKVVTGLDPGLLRETYRLEALDPGTPAGVQAVLRSVVEQYIAEHPDTGPTIYVLPDAGLLVRVKGREH